MIPKRNFLAAPFLAVMFLGASVGVSAHAQEAKQNFRLVNKTGYELKAVFVSPNAADEWGEDVLGQDTLGDSVGVNIRFSRGVKTCKWDLKVTYSVDDSDAVWKNIDLCKIESVTIKYNKNTDTTSAAFD